MKIKFLVLAALLSGVGYAERLPWAATQRLEDITGLRLPENYRNLARWKSSYAVASSDLPEYWDWRFYANGLPPVKHQRASDCWAQGTVGVLESLVKIQLNKEVDLSVQQVISCSGSGSAANGGYFAHGYHKKIGAVMTAEYPYTARDTACKKGLSPEYVLAEWGYVGAKDTKPSVIQLKQAIMEHGPIGVTIYANRALQNFSGDGVFKGCGKGQTNHIEVIVGWDDTTDGGVWFVRNSWGPSHGDNGYAKIPFGCSRVGEMATWANLKM
jgi:C1A family cysteine protease